MRTLHAEVSALLAVQKHLVPGESKERSAVHKRSRTHHVVKVADKG